MPKLLQKNNLDSNKISSFSARSREFATLFCKNTKKKHNCKKQNHSTYVPRKLAIIQKRVVGATIPVLQARPIARQTMLSSFRFSYLDKRYEMEGFMRGRGSVWDSVGNTPLIRLASLSELTGCEIYGKAEFLNPGGSIKDRAAKGIIQRAEKEGLLQPGGTIVEGTAGNTGIGLATLAPERGYQVVISMPNNQSTEKYGVLEALGADVRAVPPCPFSNQDHFYHRARRIAAELEHAIWADQFENTANAEAHYQTTGPEIWDQTEGQIDVLVAAVGTGGTLGGTSVFLKEKRSDVTIIAADPTGSGIHDYVKSGEFTGDGSSVTEGIGIKRLTANFASAKVDDAIRVTDSQMIDMLFHVARHDGLFMGTSSALNLYSAYSMGLAMKNSGKTIVTFLCDHGSRYASKVLSPGWRQEKDLEPRPLHAGP